MLLTGLTYESMLNDVFNYSCGKIIFGDAVENKLKQKTPGRAISLNNTDSIFYAVRNKHMTEVFPFLSAKAKTLQTGFDKASGKSPSPIQQFCFRSEQSRGSKRFCHA